MADYTQSAIITFIAHQALAHPGMLEGSTPYACAAALSGVITVRVANVETTANATGVGVIIQGSFETAGDDAWFDLMEFTGSTTAAETEAMTATEAAAETVLACAATANFLVGDTIYVQDASVVADGEWHRVTKIVTDTSVTIDYGLAVQKDASDFLWTEADIWTAFVDCSGLKRINVLVVHEAATGSNLHVLAEGVFTTDLE